MLKTHGSHGLRLHHILDRATPPVIHSSRRPMDGICQLIKVRTSEAIYQFVTFPYGRSLSWRQDVSCKPCQAESSHRRTSFSRRSSPTLSAEFSNSWGVGSFYYVVLSNWVISVVASLVRMAGHVRSMLHDYIPQ